MSRSVAGRVFAVTGASSGIGLAIAEAVVARGGRVVIGARRQDRIEAAATRLGPRAFAVPLDMRDAESVEAFVAAAVQRFGRIDVLVNNAGQGLHVPLEDLAISDLEAVVSLNLYGPILGMQAVLPHMRERGGGTIVNVSSTTALVAAATTGGYAATKAGLDKISEIARTEWAPYGIDIVSFWPFVTETEFHANLRAGAQAATPEIQTAGYAATALLDALERGDSEVVLAPAEVLERFSARPRQLGFSKTNR